MLRIKVCVAGWVDELGGSEVQLQYEVEELKFKMLISLASSHQQGANTVQKTRGELIFPTNQALRQQLLVDFLAG